MSDSVFEIREYLDGNGKVSGHDVLDISKELEFMAKMCGDMEQSAQGDINDDERFIRELAEIADSKENDLSAGADADDGGGAGSDEAFWSALDESESTNNASSTTSTHTTSQTKSTTSVNHQKKATAASSSGGGWKKGFLGNNKTTTKAAATPASIDTNKSTAVDSVTIGTASMTVSDSTPSSTTVKSNSDIRGTNPNSGSNVNSNTTATATTTTPAVTFAVPVESNTQQKLPEPPQPQAFSGSILERVPAPLAPLGASGKLGRLGGIRKVN